MLEKANEKKKKVVKKVKEEGRIEHTIELVFTRKKNEKEKRAPESGREYMANNWADDTDELPPLGTLSNDEPTKTTSTPKASAEKTYVPPHLKIGHKAAVATLEADGILAVVAADETFEVGYSQRNKT